VIISAAICPCPPLLARELTGQAVLLPELRAACAAAVEHLTSAQPDLIIVAGPAQETRGWDPAGRLDLAAYAPALGLRGAIPPAASVPAAGEAPALPLALGIGGLLLDAAGYAGPRAYQGVSASATAAQCLRLGRDLAAAGPRVGLLTVGDGSARRSAAAPGYLDERAAPFDAGVERAIRDGDVAAIAALDPALAAQLLAVGRPAWQVLAGALLPDALLPGDGTPGRHTVPGLRTEVTYCDAPLGVGYLVAVLDPAVPPSAAPAAPIVPTGA
jgi:hypothetical protein